MYYVNLLINMIRINYSLDISYILGSHLEDNAISNIVNKYDSCEWYASDCGAFGPGAKGPCIRSNGFMVNNIDELIEIVKKVKKYPVLFVDFVTRTIFTGNDDVDDDCEHIYNSSSRYDSIVDWAKKEYNDIIPTLEGKEKMIYVILTTKKIDI